MKEQIHKWGTNTLFPDGGQRLIRITWEGTNRKSFPILTFVQNSVKEQIIFGEKGNYKAATFNKRQKLYLGFFKTKYRVVFYAHFFVGQDSYIICGGSIIPLIAGILTWKREMWLHASTLFSITTILDGNSNKSGRVVGWMETFISYFWAERFLIFGFCGPKLPSRLSWDLWFQ